MNIGTIRAKIEMAEDVKRVLEVAVLTTGLFLYLIETPFSFPRYAVGLIDEKGETVKVLYSCGLEENAREEYLKRKLENEAEWLKNLKVGTGLVFPVTLRRAVWPCNIQIHESDEGLLLVFGNESGKRVEEAFEENEVGEPFRGPLHLNVILVNKAAGEPPCVTEPLDHPVHGLFLQLRRHSEDIAELSPGMQPQHAKAA